MQETIVKYNSSLLDEAVEYLVKLWQTKKYDLPCDMEAPCMRLVRLPDLKKYPIPSECQTVSIVIEYVVCVTCIN